MSMRPYFADCTGPHPNSEVKRRKARSVLGWGTAWEALRVPLTFSPYSVVLCCRFVFTVPFCVVVADIVSRYSISRTGSTGSPNRFNRLPEPMGTNRFPEPVLRTGAGSTGSPNVTNSKGQRHPKGFPGGPPPQY